MPTQRHVHMHNYRQTDRQTQTCMLGTRHTMSHTCTYTYEHTGHTVYHTQTHMYCTQCHIHVHTHTHNHTHTVTHTHTHTQYWYLGVNRGPWKIHTNNRRTMRLVCLTLYGASWTLRTLTWGTHTFVCEIWSMNRGRIGCMLYLCCI